MNKETYESWSRALAFILQVVGILGIVLIPIFWALTNRVELAFLPFFGTMAGVGRGLDVLREITQGRGEHPASDLSAGGSSSPAERGTSNEP